MQLSAHFIIIFSQVCSSILRNSSSARNSLKELFQQPDENYKDAKTRDKRFIFVNKQNLNFISYNDNLDGKDTFDFIVVGSGSSGSVIANRLSENEQWSVLLLEVGEKASALTNIPVLAPVFQFTNYNWNYLMEKQDNMCLGFVDQRMAWPRGRALGGTTIINYMIHVRGNPLDYDKWASLGNPGWSYNDVLPYFLKSENFLVKNEDANYHSKGGYLQVEDVPFRLESTHAWVRAAQEAGYKYVDYNGKSQLGVSYVQATLKNAFRCNAEAAFLRPIRHRKNLKILTKSRVTKVLLDEMTKTAYGVEFHQNHQIYKVFAKKEVVLSAGAFNSPQILMLSGIGPKQHLKDLDIKLVQDLPVGKKMYDHLTFLGLAVTLNESIVLQQSDLYRISSFIDLIQNGKGPLTDLGGVQALTYFRTNFSTESIHNPDMELIFIAGSLNTDNGDLYRKTFRVTDEVYNTVWKPLEGKFVVSILPMLLKPKSYGWLELKSKNPYKWPKFYGNFFTDSANDDIKAFIASIRETQRIIKQPSFLRYGAEQVKTKIPGCQQLIFDTDEYWECALRHISATLHHQIATCKMGPKHDSEAVVDHELKVYGIKNLRVADTSIIPIPLAAHTNVPAYMVGEKASDLIKKDWNK